MFKWAHSDCLLGSFWYCCFFYLLLCLRMTHQERRSLLPVRKVIHLQPQTPIYKKHRLLSCSFFVLLVLKNVCLFCLNWFLWNYLNSGVSWEVENGISVIIGVLSSLGHTGLRMLMWCPESWMWEPLWCWLTQTPPALSPSLLLRVDKWSTNSTGL